MKRRWGPSGISTTNWQPVEIDEGTKQQIAVHLRSKDIDQGDLNEFFKSMSEALAYYHSEKEIYESSKPGVVRNNLQSAIDAAIELNETLNNLDGNSNLLLSETSEGGIRQLKTKTFNILSILSDAKCMADEYPKGGRLQDHARTWLAVDVARGIRKHLNVEPTSTKEGTYYSLLEIFLTLATGKASKSVDDLARKALKVVVKESPGLTEYAPPNPE